MYSILVYCSLTPCPKPSQKQLKRVRHHFIGHLSISNDYNASRFETESLDELRRIFQKKRTCPRVTCRRGHGCGAAPLGERRSVSPVGQHCLRLAMSAFARFHNKAERDGDDRKGSRSCRSGSQKAVVRRAYRASDRYP